MQRLLCRHGRCSVTCSLTLVWLPAGPQIRCDGVDYTSRTFDPFLDLSLEIQRAHSLERALAAFTAGEVLDGPNKYRCPKNNQLVSGGGRAEGHVAWGWGGAWVQRPRCGD
jgi:hypothetical protein